MTGPYFVEILSGREVRHRYRVDELPIRVGRAYDNDVILDDPHVSPHHARVELADDGGLLVRDTGSRNGILRKRRRCAELAINGDTVFKLGHVNLRVRPSDFQVAEEIRDTAFHGWEGWPPALAGLALLICLTGFESWLETTDKFESASYLMGIVAVVSLGCIWCGGWAFANRLFGGSARLGRHLFILGCGFAVMRIWELVCDFLGYGLSWELFTRYGSHGSIAIFAVMICFHYNAIKPGRYRAIAVASIVVAVICSGIKLMIEYRFSGIPADELVMYERMPPSLRISPDKPVSRLIDDAARMKSAVDRERARLAPGDETESEDQE